jgi:hypothetical protein
LHLQNPVRPRKKDAFAQLALLRLRYPLNVTSGEADETWNISKTEVTICLVFVEDLQW